MGRVRDTEDVRTETARDLRRRQTLAEAILWQEMRAHRLAGLKFRRQQPLGPYIVDFYCLEHPLVIELDGPVHETQQDHDDARTEYLEAYGCTVLRFRNADVLTNLRATLSRIEFVANHLGARNVLPKGHLPSPAHGRGAGGEGYPVAG